MEINDIRNTAAFRGGTFSEYKIADVKSACINEIEQANVVNTFYWFMELLCSGHVNEIWEIIIQFYANKINVGNPKVAVYLDMVYTNYEKILANGYTNYELAMRNNSKVRDIFCEIAIILCSSTRTPTFEKIKIIDSNDFDLEKLSNKLKAPNTSFVDIIFQDDDPYELYIPINELAYSLSKENGEKNLWNTIYWVEWILQYSKQYFKKYDDVIKVTQRKINVNQTHKKDFIWLIWDVILNKSLVYFDIQKKIIQSLFKLFLINYKPGSKEKRKHLIFFACKVIINVKNINFQVPIISNKEDYDVEEIMKRVFNELKKSEQTPNTGYLNIEEERTNVEKTVEKITAINSFLGET